MLHIISYQGNANEDHDRDTAGQPLQSAVTAPSNEEGAEHHSHTLLVGLHSSVQFSSLLLYNGTAIPRHSFTLNLRPATLFSGINPREMKTQFT